MYAELVTKGLTMTPLQLGSLDGWALDTGVHHLNHGSFGAVTNHIASRQSELLDESHARPVSWFTSLPDRIALARAEVAALLGVPEPLAAFTTNVSAAASAVFASLPLREGDEVLVTDHAYGAVAMGAARWAKRAGATVVTAHVPLDATDDDILGHILEAVTPHTRAVLIDQITSGTARLMPTTRLAGTLRERGVITIVDGAHAPGLIESPFTASDADLWFGNMHKWACSPPGCAVLAARAPFVDALNPVIDSWGAGLDYPARFDQAGTTDLTPWLLAAEAWQQLDHDIGWPEIREHADQTVAAGAELVASAIEEATGKAATVGQPTPAPAMRLVRLPGRLGVTREQADSYRTPISQQASCECAFTSFDGIGYVRLSGFAYNRQDDYQAFAERAVPLLLDWASHS